MGFHNIDTSLLLLLLLLDVAEVYAFEIACRVSKSLLLFLELVVRFLLCQAITKIIQYRFSTAGGTSSSTRLFLIMAVRSIAPPPRMENDHHELGL